jgi:hypothetical protein
VGVGVDVGGGNFNVSGKYTLKDKAGEVGLGVIVGVVVGLGVIVDVVVGLGVIVGVVVGLGVVVGVVVGPGVVDGVAVGTPGMKTRN